MERPDFRGPEEMRPLGCQLGIISEANGSCLFSHGKTEVTASVYGPSQPRYIRHEAYDSATLEVEFLFLGNVKNHVSMGKGDSQLATQSQSEVASRPLPGKSGVCQFNQSHVEKDGAQFVRQSLISSININAYPRMLILLRVCVVQDEGSRLSCAVNACVLALLDAGILMFQIPCSISTSMMRSLSSPYHDETTCIVLDPSSAEESDERRLCNATHTFIAKQSSANESNKSIICSELRGSGITKEHVRQIEDFALRYSGTTIIPFLTQCSQVK